MKLIFAFLFGLILLLLEACKSTEIPFDPPVKQQIFLSNVSITQNFVKSTVDIELSYGLKTNEYFEVTELGLCWSTQNTKPSVKNRTISIPGSQTTNRRFNAKNLDIFHPDSTYYISAYAKAANGEVYYGRDGQNQTQSYKLFSCDNTPVAKISVKSLKNLIIGTRIIETFEYKGSYFLINEVGVIYQYNTLNDSWEIHNQAIFDTNLELSQGFESIQIFIIKDKIYAGMGIPSRDPNETRYFFELDFEKKQWKKLPSVELPSRYADKFAVTDSSCIFTIASESSLSEYIPGKTFLRGLHKIDPFDQIYTSKILAQFQREIVFMGRYVTGGSVFWFSHDLATKKTKQLNIFDPIPCFGSDSDYYPDLIWATGRNLNLFKKGSITATVLLSNIPIFQYNTSNNAWEKPISLKGIEDQITWESRFLVMGGKLILWNPSKGEFYEIAVPK